MKCLGRWFWGGGESREYYSEMKSIWWTFCDMLGWKERKVFCKLGVKSDYIKEFQGFIVVVVFSFKEVVWEYWEKL